MLYLSFIALIVYLCWPFFMLFALWKKRHENKLHWVLHVLVTGAFITLFFLIGRWDWISYYVRFLLLLLFFISSYRSFQRVKNIKNPNKWTWILYNLFSLFFLLVLNAWALRGYFYSDKSIELSFPLKNGVYYIAHGGNSSLLNNHYASDSQRYALDIVKLNTFGNRASSIYPKEFTAYSIWEDTVYSPCDGKIVESMNTLPDNIPPHSDSENLAGNYILIECKGAKVLLAHLKKGSLIHEVGATIREGDAVAKVGNSGNTTEPHLHIQTVKNEEKTFLESDGIPMTFDGSFLVRNSLVINSQK